MKSVKSNNRKDFIWVLSMNVSQCTYTFHLNTPCDIKKLNIKIRRKVIKVNRWSLMSTYSVWSMPPCVFWCGEKTLARTRKITRAIDGMGWKQHRWTYEHAHYPEWHYERTKRTQTNTQTLCRTLRRTVDWWHEAEISQMNVRICILSRITLEQTKRIQKRYSNIMLYFTYNYWRPILFFWCTIMPDFMHFN